MNTNTIVKESVKTNVKGSTAMAHNMEDRLAKMAQLFKEIGELLAPETAVNEDTRETETEKEQPMLTVLPAQAPARDGGKRSATGYLGVSAYHNRRVSGEIERRYMYTIAQKGAKKIYKGGFKTPEEAKVAREQKLQELLAEHKRKTVDAEESVAVTMNPLVTESASCSKVCPLDDQVAYDLWLGTACSLNDKEWIHWMEKMIKAHGDTKTIRKVITKVNSWCHSNLLCRLAWKQKKAFIAGLLPREILKITVLDVVAVDDNLKRAWTDEMCKEISKYTDNRNLPELPIHSKSKAKTGPKVKCAA